ncbi:MAG TPA: cysteine desulfurase family protein [Chloroflexota bacterium]|nr:cysteine desulfurase family protein [Chloroflexota bacterium]
MISPFAPGDPIYLDYNATTPVDPRVAAVVADALRNSWGNPSSAHAYSARAHAAMDAARGQLAALLGCAADELVFTGAGSESDNLAIKGIAFASRGRGDHLVTSAVEHPAVLNACRWLAERLGFRLTILPVDGTGRVDPDALRRAVEPGTVLVSVMHANNEVGTLNPIAELAAVCHERGVPFHTDAAQSVGKVPARVDELGVDLLTVAAHKLYAPKGIGALYVRRGTRLDSLVHGAGHEGGRRAGTENVPYAAALGRAAELCQGMLPGDAERLRALRDRLHAALAERVPGLELNGHPTERLPNTLNVSFPRVDGEELLAATPGVAASTGSACHAGRTDPSSVLLAMGITPARALGAVRLTLGRWSTADEVDRAAALLAESWRHLAG